MDVVYILGTHSRWQDNEIRYSLRSLQKHMADLRNVFVVGEHPDWLQNVTHIPMPDGYGLRWKNAYTKTLAACQHPDLSEEFLFMNDDFYMTEPFVGAEWPYYHKGSLGVAKIGNRLVRGTSGHTTYSLLQSLKKPTANFQMHCPLRYEKQKYIDMPISAKEPGIISPRSFYCNFYEIPGTLTKEFFMFGRVSVPSMLSLAKRAPWFSSLNATVTNKEFEQFINILYPEPSRFEKAA